MAARKSTFAMQKVWDKAKVFNQEPTLNATAWRKVIIVSHSDGNLAVSVQSKNNWAWRRTNTGQRLHSKNHLQVSDNVFQSKTDKAIQP